MVDRSTAFVTGAGRGVGRAIAIALAAEGVRVALAARTIDQLEETHATIAAAGGTSIPLHCDVTDFASIELALGLAHRAFGGIDVLVNNAGHGGVQGPTWTTDPKAWWETFNVNVRGVYLMCRAVLPEFTARRGGRIINVASGVGAAPTPYSTSYGASKAAVFQFTESLAVSCAPFHVQVFAISPGLVHTTMTDKLVNDDIPRRWLPQFKNAKPEQWLDPAMAGALVVRLARGDADALTGRYIHAADNLDAYIAAAERIAAEEMLVLRMKKP